MKRFFLAIALLMAGSSLLTAQPDDFIWQTPSENSSESMPLGGSSVGMNVWVEQGDILLYLSRSGCFDENNSLLKLGRFRIRLSEPLDMGSFEQRLVLSEGYMTIGDGKQTVTLWADVHHPAVHVDIDCRKGKATYEVAYESWRTADRPLTKREAFQSSYKFGMPAGISTKADSIRAEANDITFFHHNSRSTIFDATVEQQRLQEVKHQMYNPLGGLLFGGRMKGTNLTFKETRDGTYQDTPYTAFVYTPTVPARHHSMQIVLATTQAGKQQWLQLLSDTERAIRKTADRKASRQWWQQFWQRSYISSDTPQAQQLTRNYTLFRFMLGCNAYGEWPTKFNGGLFTFDPRFVNKAEEYRLSPDFRNWGGGVHTAQNQRLVYWPMLKSGDTDMMTPQIDFYNRCLGNAELRSDVYWHHAGACYTEQIENYGLPNFAEYGTKRPADFDAGMERNAWLEYEWDTALEFCLMALESHRYANTDITGYEKMIASVLTFFDEHYKLLARQRGAKTLDDDSHIILYPGSGGETFKMAYNPSSTIAALLTVGKAFTDYLAAKPSTPHNDSLLALHRDMLGRVPPLPMRTIEGHTTIAPATTWARVNNTEPTMLYPVFPWRIYGIGRPDIDVARNTFLLDPYAKQFRSHVGWKQDNIWAACLGLTDEAKELCIKKLSDGPYRFPAFWGPGFDWSPDHNWGGSGMIGLQEMLLQEADGKIYLFPAWPREWNVSFRLHASGGTVVEAAIEQGKPRLISISPESRKQDVVF